MLVKKLNKYESSKKKMLKKEKSLEDRINYAEELLSIDHMHSSLDFKKIICKKDKSRKSIKIAGTQYRILLTEDDDTFILICVCDHDRYQLANKHC